jgi:transposase
MIMAIENHGKAEAALLTHKDFLTFVGVDLHKTTVTLTAVDSGGEVVARLTTSTKAGNKIQDWLDKLPRPIHMAVESVGFVEWFIDRFTFCVERIDIADATALALLRGKRRKNDKNDSIDCAKRLARGECPLGYIAPREIMRLRKMGRHWRRLSHTISRAKNGMRGILNAANFNGPTEITAASAQTWLLNHGHGLMDVQAEAFSDLLDIVGIVERQQEQLRRRIIKICGDDRFRPSIELLQSIPGVGEIFSCVIFAEIGNFERFPNADALEFWAGLTPDNKESAGRTQSGNITKAGSATLRWAVCCAAMNMCKNDQRQKTRKIRLRKRIGVKAKVNVAMGRRLLRIIFAMMRDGTIFEKRAIIKRKRTQHAAKVHASASVK